MSFNRTAENVQTAIELWNSGKSGPEIAEAINAPSRGAVTRKISRLRAQGFALEMRPSPIGSARSSVAPGMFAWTAEIIQTAIELWSQDKTGSQIGEAIHAPSPGSVRRKLGHLRAQGVPVEPHRPPTMPKAVNIGAAFPVVRAVAPEWRNDGSVLLVETGTRQCRYPLWEKQSDPKLVCGRRTVNPLSSWCEEHERLVWKMHDRPPGKLRPTPDRDEWAIGVNHPLTDE